MPGGESESMRTDIPISSTVGTGSMRDRIRAELGRARRRFAARSPALRWSVGLAALAIAATLAYAVTMGTTTAEPYVSLRSGGRFSSDDRHAIQNAFDLKHIRYKIDRQNRVEVAADQLTEALEALGKLNIGRKGMSKIHEEEQQDNMFELPRTRELREARLRNEWLETLIQPIDDRIVSVSVRLNQPDARISARRAGPVSAFVSLELDSDRKLSDTTIEKIRSMIASAEPDVKHDAVSVFDQTGRRYLDAQDPGLNALSKNRARQEELRQEILERLEWLKGVQVSVQLVPGPAIPPPTPLPPLPPQSRMPAIEPAPTPAIVDTADRAPAPTVGVNQPLELSGEDVSEPPLAASPAQPPEPVSSLPQAPVQIVPAPPPAPEPPTLKAKVLVQVPRSYYVNAMPDSKLSSSELQALAERTRGDILKVVRHVVQPGQLEEPVDVSSFPDDLAVVRSSEPAPELRKVVSWWIPAGVAAGATTAILLIGFRVRGARPALGSANRTGSASGAGGRRDDRGRFKIDEASDPRPGPGPSERVRELIRLNPEAAASVLQRWTGQGGQAE